MDAIDNITIGHTERLYKPVGYTMLTNLVNIVPAFPLKRYVLFSARLTGADSRLTQLACGTYSV